MRTLLTSAFMMAAGVTTFIAALLRKLAMKLAHDSAMMAAMSTGMMGVLEGVMAGLMGGTMGAMMGGMMPGRGVPLLLAVTFVTALMAGLTVRLLTQQPADEGHHGAHGQHHIAWSKPVWWTAFALLVSGVVAWFSLGALSHRLPGGGSHHHGSPLAVTVTATELSFSPSVVEVPAGKTVRLQFRNEGTQEHDLNIQGLEYLPVGRQDLRSGPSGFHMYAQPGGQVAADFVPLRTGEYEVYCSVPGHREAGMHIVLRVSTQN